MSLDITQNIVLYLLIIITVISLFLFYRILVISKHQRKSNKTLKRLKQEITKIQIVDNKILKSITLEDTTTHNWEEEDKIKRQKKKQKKQLRKQKRSVFFNNLFAKLPNNFEQYAGEQILDKIGITSFLIGLALFINVSVESEWINNFGKLFLGIFLTIIFLIIGYLSRKKYMHFSNIIIGGGIATFIFAIFSAHYQYHVISLPIWAITTIFIISATILISISIKRHEIAIITFVAAYVAPFTVKFIGNDYIVLFSYLTVLNLGVLIYDYYQKSIIINFLSFGFTFIIYGIWLISKIYFKNEEIPYLEAFIFLTLYYIMYVFIVIINNLREGKKFQKADFSMMMTAKALYLSVGLTIINQAGVNYQGLFAGLIAIINYSFFLALHKNKKLDKKILNQFLGLSIMFFALIIPFEFYGKTITMVWAFQASLLMFISVRARLESMKQTSFFLTIGMIISLFIDMYNQYISSTNTFEQINLFFNQSFLTSLLAIFSLIAIIFLLPNDKFFLKKLIKIKNYKIFLYIVLGIVGYATFFLEIKTAAVQKLETTEAINTTISIYNIAFLTIATIPVLIKKLKPLAITALSTTSVAALLYIFYYAAIYVNLRNGYLLSTKITQTQFLVHYIAPIMIIFALLTAIKNIKTIFHKKSKYSYITTIILTFFTAYILSSEVTNTFVVKLYEPNRLIQDIVSKLQLLGFSITWGFTSMLILIIGFRTKTKEHKTIAIALYIITILKIIFFDFWTATNQDLMLSFGTMGLIMLISSFFFQFKKNEQTTKKDILAK